MRVSHSQGIGFSVAREMEAINVSNKTNSSKSDGLQRKDQGSRLKACNTALFTNELGKRSIEKSIILENLSSRVYLLPPAPIHGK